jgi:hypothetical protein
LRYASLSVSRDLVVRCSTDLGIVEVKLGRVAAQHLAATLRCLSGAPSRGVELNAGNMRTVSGERLLTDQEKVARRNTRPIKI